MKLEHLKMIQKIVDRMANNSFLLKGWAILVITTIFTFASNKRIDNNIQVILFTNVLLLVFWGLDSYYLQQERKFRKLYDFVRLKKGNNSDFNMNTNQVTLTINESKKLCYFNCFLSITESLFYSVCIIMTVLVYLYL